MADNDNDYDMMMIIIIVMLIRMIIIIINSPLNSPMLQITLVCARLQGCRQVEEMPLCRTLVNCIYNTIQNYTSKHLKGHSAPRVGHMTLFNQALWGTAIRSFLAPHVSYVTFFNQVILFQLPDWSPPDDPF